MNDKENIKELIIDCLKNRYQIAVEGIEQLALGADVSASVYKVKSEGNKSYFIKVRTNQDDDFSLLVLETLKKAGIKNIILPMTSIDNCMMEKCGNFQLTVFPFVEGDNGFDRHLTDQQWISLGETLSKIHSIEIPSNLRAQVRIENFSTSSIDKVHSLLSKLDTFEIKDVWAGKFIELLSKHKSTVLKMFKHCKKLTGDVKSKDFSFVLCHADLHAGNVLLSGDGSFFIVDWDEPILAPIEKDLMFIGGGVGNTWNQASEVELFYSGYGKQPIDQKALAYFRLERIFQDIAVYSEELVFKCDATQDRKQLFKEISDQFHPNGVVEIALESYKKSLLTT